MAGIAEPISCLSHMISGVIFFAAVLLLLPQGLSGKRQRLAFFSYVFGVGGMFFASGAYHLVDEASSIRHSLWFLDHGMIWFAIAGTISLYVVLWIPRAPYTLGILWALAISGLVLENLFLRDLAPWASPLLYIGMGWVGIFKVIEITKSEGLRFTYPILTAGLTSTLGGVVDAVEWPNLIAGVVQAHEIMHFLIAAGMFQFLWGLRRCVVRFGVGASARAAALDVPSSEEVSVPSHSVA